MGADYAAPPSDTVQFVVQAQTGDRVAFRRLVERYQNAVSAVALAAVRDIALSEDVAQSAFLEAWTGLPRLRRAESFGPWLLQLARRQALAARRSGTRAQSRDHHWSSLQPDTAADAEAAAHAVPNYRDLCAALDQIPDDARELLLLYYREGRSTHQVAELLELSEAAVRKRLERARTTLRTRFVAIGALVLASVPGAAFAALALGSLGAQAAAGPSGRARLRPGSRATALRVALSVVVIGAVGWLAAHRPVRVEPGAGAERNALVLKAEHASATASPPRPAAT